MRPSVATAAACLVICLGGADLARAESSEQDGSLADESLESLLQMEVTSVSKRPQRISETPAAIFVITQEDIRRSGHANVAELLRLVPGVNVGQATAKRWDIGVRGDQSGFSRMLLVLLDGRATYNSSFNGTFWELNDVPLEEIERIEVIRGPGASVWGANAVHGVINIIRRKPEGQGSFLTTAIGTEDRLVTSLGHTDDLGRLRYRVSGHYVNREEFRSRDDSGHQHDDYRHATTAWRADFDVDAANKLTFQGDWYGGDRGLQVRRDPDTSGSTPIRSFETGSVSGGNAIVRFERKHSESAMSELQFYVDRSYRDIVLVTDRRTHYDLELRNRFRLGQRQLINWGLGTRHVQESQRNTLNFIATPDRQDEALYSFHAQDEIAIVPDVLSLTLGSKVEWNTFTGWEFQPTARALWHPAERHQIWAAFSRGVRTPARFDRGEYSVRPGYLFGMPIEVSGQDGFDSEVVLASDLGWRYQPSASLHLDLTGYTHRTQNFAVFVPKNPPFFLTQELNNLGERSAIGAEASVRWQPTERWRLTLGWSHIHITHSSGLYATGGNGSAPPHQLSLRSSLDLPGNLELDLGVAYHGRTGERVGLLGDEFGGYTRHDVRLGWRPSAAFELSLVGQNLLDRLHREGTDFFENDPVIAGLPQSSVQRSLYARATWRF